MTSKASKKAAAGANGAASKTNAPKHTACHCGKQALRLDDETLRAVFFGQIVAAYEKHNMEVQDETGHEDMSLADVFDSAAEVADLMIEDVRERRGSR